MRARSRAMVIAAALVTLAHACKPDLGDPDSRVTEVRILAVRAEPAEAKPGVAVVYTALVAAKEGTLDDAPVGWSFCTAPKALAENNVVSPECLGDDAAIPFGAGPSASGTTPADACATFGPDAPPGGFRPRDADVTGGYFQPVRARFPGGTAFALARIACNLSNTSVDNAREFAERYVPNRNPHIAALTALVDGAPVPLDAIPAGARVTLRAAWSDGDAETYVRLDPATQTIVTARESMRVSWYSTEGTFESDRTGRDESDAQTTSDDVWTAPSHPGTVHLWVVLRDSRGGLDFAAEDLGIL